MAAVSCVTVAVPSVAVSAKLEKSAFVGATLPSLPVKKSSRSRGTLQVVASGGKKTVTKTPLGPSGESKFKVDAGGSPSKGKGTFQFVKKYGANVDGYSPIWTPDVWSAKGEVYEGGAAGIALWAVTFGALLAAGGLLVFYTSSLA